MSSSRQGKRPEKSNFVQTCNLLSRYIKEKGSLRDLNIEIGGKVDSFEAIVNPAGSTSASTTMDVLLTGKGKSAQPSLEQHTSMAQDYSINTTGDAQPTSKEATTAAGQLTIFYSGRVLVFDDYPADKAEELVAFAKNESSQMRCGILSNTLCEKHSASPRQGLPPPSPRPQPQKPVGISSNTCKAKTNTRAERVSSCTETSGSDMPIARRSSLHRFLEKRKDRGGGRGPYQVQEQPTYSTKGDEQLELKL